MKSICALLMLCWALTGVAAEGLVQVRSPRAPGETLDRFEAAARERGLRVFARIDHAAGAAEAGLTLRPTQVLIFGHPKGGTPLMQCAQTLGIDLPLKALAWTDADGQSWLAWNDPDHLARRHDAAGCAAFEALRRLLPALGAAAVAP